MELYYPLDDRMIIVETYSQNFKEEFNELVIKLVKPAIDLCLMSDILGGISIENIKGNITLMELPRIGYVELKQNK